MIEEEGLTSEEKAALEGLSSKITPPAHLEKSVISALKEEGLIKTKVISMNPKLKWLSSVAATVLIFLAGSYWERKSSSIVEIDPTLGYMLILREDENFKPAEPMAMFKEYSAWLQTTSEQGITITGQELREDAVLINTEEERSLDAQASQRITGYFISRGQFATRSIGCCS